MKTVNNSIIPGFAQNNELNSLTEAIEAGADVNEKNEFGATGLHYSISEENHDITRVLLDHGADVTVQDSEGMTPLHYAVEYDACDIAEALLKENSKVIAISDKHGNEPLWTAAFNSGGNYELVTLLLQHGADVTHENNTGLTPLDVPKRMGDDALTKLLESSLGAK